MENKIIFIDGECSLCNRFVDLVFKFDKKQEFNFYLLDGAEGELKTIVYFENNIYFSKYKAVSKVLKSTNLFLKVVFLFFDLFPKFLTNFVYDFVAKNRNTVFGRGYCTPIPHNRKITREEISSEVLTKAKGLSLGYS